MRARLPWVPVTIMAIVLVCAVFAPLVAPHDPTEISMLDAKLAPGEDLRYPLGTDIMGRDMGSRLIYGARTALFISLIALGTGAFVGTVLVLQRRFKEGRVGRHEGRLDAWHGSVWPARCILASPPATAAVQPARTVPGAASPAPPGRPAVS